MRDTKELVKAMSEEMELWQWEYTDDAGKRRKTTYLLTEEDAKARFLDPARVPHTREVRRPLGHTSDWMKRS